MEQDRIRWNKKYRDGSHPDHPSEIVKRFYALAPKGRALDIAAGTGRNALFLADRGFIVDAVDVSDVAMTALDGRHPSVTPICTDLDAYDIPPDRYALIINTRFLDRRLFPYIIEGLLKPGGVLIFQTFMEPLAEGEGSMEIGIRCRDYLLRSNELLHAFLKLNIIYYAEQSTTGSHTPGPSASLVGMRVV